MLVNLLINLDINMSMCIFFFFFFLRKQVSQILRMKLDLQDLFVPTLFLRILKYL